MFLFVLGLLFIFYEELLIFLFALAIFVLVLFLLQLFPFCVLGRMWNKIVKISLHCHSLKIYALVYEYKNVSVKYFHNYSNNLFVHLTFYTF